MIENEFDVEMHPGRRHRSLKRTGGLSLAGEVVRASKRQGMTSLAKGQSKPRGTGRHGRGRDIALRYRQTDNGRRVVVKARIVRSSGRAFASGPLTRHIDYLQREGVTRDQQRGDLFDADRDGADGQAFSARCQDDRHHFRFIISPEDALELADLRLFTRELMHDMALDLGTTLDWVGADHWNTDNPHVHVLVRGKTSSGEDLIVDREYMRHGLRFRAEQRATLELGMRSEREVQTARRREIAAERWTSLDTGLVGLQDGDGVIDLRFDTTGNRQLQTQLVGRINMLADMGLANELEPGRWRLESHAEEALRQMELRGDIIKTLHKSWTDREASRDLALSAQQDQPGLIQSSRLDVGEPLCTQQISPGDPALQNQLPPEARRGTQNAAYRHEVGQTLQTQSHHLVGPDQPSSEDGKPMAISNGTHESVQSELAKVADVISKESGMTMLPSQLGDHVEGTYRKQLSLPVGRFALIDNGFGFQLVPWEPSLERHLGQTVSGMVRESGRVDWTFERTRTIGI